jgi:2-keto-4-pentenoate hydratase/2-oxohepta-3-ene-1,7-dioic acid hydratase in catechol pathway
MELGVVIGRPLGSGKGVNAKDVEGHVFGFVVLNDWSGTFSSASLFEGSDPTF